MFIDYALLILGGLVVLAYVILNVLVVYHYTIPFMWQEFWVNQKVFGRICINLFYLPSWVIKFVMVVLVVVLNVIIIPLYKLFKGLAKFINPIYKQALKLNI